MELSWHLNGWAGLFDLGWRNLRIPAPPHMDFSFFFLSEKKNIFGLDWFLTSLYFTILAYTYIIIGSTLQYLCCFFFLHSLIHLSQCTNINIHYQSIIITTFSFFFNFFFFRRMYSRNKQRKTWNLHVGITVFEFKESFMPSTTRKLESRLDLSYLHQNVLYIFIWY